VVLHYVSRHTTFGVATSAGASNRRAPAALGLSPDLVATVTWSVGTALAAVAGILIVPMSGLDADQLTLVVVVALAAALAGGFSSFTWTLVAGVGIGIGQSLMAQYVTQPGASDALPLVVIMLVLLIRGRSLPTRSAILERLPKIGTGVLRPRLITVLAVLVSAGMLTIFSQGLTVAITVQVIVAIILLSLVILAGYAGQVSLAQYGLAGMGGYISARLVAAAHWPFPVAVLAGVLGATLVGVLFGIPALRTRGVNLAVVTLGLGFAVEVILFDNGSYTGGITGTNVGDTSLFGLNIGATAYPGRFGIFCLLCLIVAVVIAARVRRGALGRSFIAVRANERAAASVGINVVRAKLVAFGLASAVAGLGGVLLAFESQVVDFTQFDIFTSINAVTFATIGGIGYLTGPLLGSGLASGAIPSYLLQRFGSLDEWLPVIGGVSVLLTLLRNPNGLAGAAESDGDPVVRWFRGRLPRRAAGPGAAAAAGAADADGPATAQVRQRAAPKALVVEGLTVRFGGVTAVDNLSLTIGPGEVVGLIGPNGAGKTTVIDAVTGFVRPARGSITLGDDPLSALPPHRRTAAGVTRSFQSVELFDDLTVGENLQAAEDLRQARAPRQRAGSWRRSRPRLSALSLAVAGEFDLLTSLDDDPAQLPHGRRRLLGIGRAVVTQPSVLLLDEPAAGLDGHESAELAALIRRLATEWGIGVLLVEHDMSVVMSTCDRVAVLEFGLKIAEGKPEVIRSDPRVIAAYLGRAPSAAGIAAGDGAAAADGAAVADSAAVAVRVTPDGAAGRPAGAVLAGDVPRRPAARLAQTRQLSVGYHGIPVLHGVDLHVEAGEVVGLLGPNGAGKTTTLLAIAGELPVASGEVTLFGQRAAGALHQRAQDGLSFVTEERSVFMRLSVLDNLRVGRVPPAAAFDLFPELRSRSGTLAGELSGGEQQMLTLARALARKPRLLLADELSLGLAPQVIERLLQAIRRAAREQGVGSLIVEQHVSEVLEYADRIYVMSRGKIEYAGSAADFAHNRTEIEHLYLGGVLAG
jgi:ABC-type branched-subunit amino acid transport system ATPase component/ABC-type branched-subunit amino acid transport system permease subunit